MGADAADDMSDGYATFPLFDDFSGTSLDEGIWITGVNVAV